MDEPIDAHRDDEPQQQSDVPDTHHRDRAIRKLFELGPHVSTSGFKTHSTVLRALCFQDLVPHQPGFATGSSDLPTT